MPDPYGRILRLAEQLDIREEAHRVDREYIEVLETKISELYSNTPHQWLKKELYEILRSSAGDE